MPVAKATIEQLAKYDSLGVFRCSACECVNTAWDGSEKFEEIILHKRLVVNGPCCKDRNCSCHKARRGGRSIQAKKIHVGKGKDTPL